MSDAKAIRLQKLVARRAALTERAAQQRGEIAEIFHRFERPADLFDKGFALARGVRSHPVIAMTVGLVAVAYLRRYVGAGRITGMALTALRFGALITRALPPRR